MIHAGLRLAWSRLRSRRLLTAQLALLHFAIMVIANSGVLLWKKASQPHGFDPLHLHSIQVYSASRSFHKIWWYQHPDRQRDLLEKVRALPGVEFAALATMGPETFTPGAFHLRPPGREAVRPLPLMVSETFDRLMKFQILAGRWWSAAESRVAPTPIVIDVTAAGSWGGPTAALGLKLNGARGEEYQVVGVIAPIPRYFGGQWDGPVAILPARKGWAPDSLVFRTASGTSDAILKEIHDAIKAHAPDAEVTIRAPDFAARPSLRDLSSASVCMLLILLGAVSLGGALWLEVARRVPELGLRRALGATSRQLHIQVWLEAGVQAVWASLLAVVLHVHLFWFSGLWPPKPSPGLSSPFSPATLMTHGLTTFLLLLLVLAASWFPARRAARVQPIAALRHD